MVSAVSYTMSILAVGETLMFIIFKNLTDNDNILEKNDEDDIDDETSRVLSNVRCLGEGVDVPALDGIMFLHPRKSQIDIVQSVGRVMRKSEGKNLGCSLTPEGVEKVAVLA